jgi:hypothetical protein
MADMQERLEALKHLGVKATYSENAIFYTYSCTVYVHNYTNFFDRTPRDFEKTVRWNAGGDNLKAALIGVAGDDSKWNLFYKLPDTDIEYRSFFNLQSQVESDIQNPAKRARVRIHIWFPV